MAPSRAFTRLATLRTLARPRSQICSRLYHSYDHPAPPGVFSDAERAILSAAYKHVPEHGFTQRALSLGAKEAGYPDISPTILPDGSFSLIKYHLVTKREALAPKAAEIFNAPISEGGEPDAGAGAQGQTMSVEGRVERLTWERLLLNQEIIRRWQEALAVMAQPTRVPASLHELGLLADEIYHLAGDISVDPSWYTKRGSLSTIYASSELFMTNDRSPGFGETRAFLDRRLKESSKLGGMFADVRQWVGFTAAAGVNVLRSKGVRI